MKRFLIRTQVIILVPLALAACIGPFARSSPFAYDKKGDLVEFNYAWPAEVAASRPLARRLRVDLERSFKAAEAYAMADRAQATASNRPFEGHRYSKRWTTAGQSARLLSLDGRSTSFTGGASPTSGAEGLLWDRSTRTPVAPAALFSSSDASKRLLRPTFCERLEAERLRRLGEASGNGGNLPCPALSALAVVPSDTNANRRFDRILLIAPQGAAGARVEGSYDVAIPVTATLLAAMKPAYRPSFEIR